MKTLQDIPKGCRAYRSLDVAHEAPHDKNKDPDYTALSPLILKDQDGYYWLLGNYHTGLIDKPAKASDHPVIGRVRRLAGDRNNCIAMQAKLDIELQETYGYSRPKFVITKDSGAGSGDYQSILTRLTEVGASVITDRSPNNVIGKKAKDFIDFAAAAENGLIRIVPETWPKDTLEAFLKELEAFDGVTKSTRTRKDDWVDATALCFNNLKSSARPYRTPNRNLSNTATLSAGILNR